jgi:hypothetical protein
MAISSHFIIIASLLMASWMWFQDDKTAIRQWQALSQFMELCISLRNPWVTRRPREANEKEHLMTNEANEKVCETLKLLATC